MIASLSEKATKEQNLSFWRFYIDSLYRLDGANEPRPRNARKTRQLRSLARDPRPSGSFAIITKSGEIVILPHPMANPQESAKRRVIERRLRSGAVNMAKTKQRIATLFKAILSRRSFLPFRVEGNGFLHSRSREHAGEKTRLRGGHRPIPRATSAETEAERFPGEIPTGVRRECPSHQWDFHRRSTLLPTSEYGQRQARLPKSSRRGSVGRPSRETRSASNSRR